MELSQGKISQLQLALEQQPSLEEFSKTFAQTINMQELVDAQNQEVIDFVSQYEKHEAKVTEVEAKLKTEADSHEKEVKNMQARVEEH